MCKARKWLAVATVIVAILAVATCAHALVWRYCRVYSTPHPLCSGCLKTTDPPYRCILFPDQDWYTCELAGSLYEECWGTSGVCQDRDNLKWWWPQQGGSCLCFDPPNGYCHGEVTMTRVVPMEIEASFR